MGAHHHILLTYSRIAMDIYCHNVETLCAFTNIGLSWGITPNLCLFDKAIMLTMVVGRSGSLTLILALRKIAIRKEFEPIEIAYPEERIMLS